jgi:hypothetical protein
LPAAQADATRLGDALLVASAIRSRLGELLVSLGWLDRVTLDAGLAAQAKSGRRAA